MISFSPILIQKSQRIKEILNRIKKIQKIGGAKHISSNFESLLEKDFDPKIYDEEMNQNFDENYYDDEEKNEDDIKGFF